MRNEKIGTLIDNIEKVIIGKTETIKLLIVGLLTNGHILIEDVPGVGKTMMVLALAKSINADFSRIQFTPDLLPSDVTGGFIYNPKTSEFDLRKGPLFTNLLLADEVNRTTPRTQSALLESMQESKVSLDGTTLELPKPFMVIATQNPIEYQGTYPLPEAQIDRFFMKIGMGYLSNADEVRVITNQKSQHPVEELQAVLCLDDVLALQAAVKKIEVSACLLEYIVKLVCATRNKEEIQLGASPRASITLMKASAAWALIEGRDYVIPDDIIYLAPFALQHRISLLPKAAITGKTTQSIIADILKTIPIP